MLSADTFLSQIRSFGIEFFTGVPDSLLKDICGKITDEIAPEHHVIAANEGAALALASGWYLASGLPALVYLQNSGLGNLVNPLTSLNDPLVYQIPALLLIGWRGEPGVADEPQHVKQGAITEQMLDCLGIPYFVLPSDDHACAEVVANAMAIMKERSAPVALLVRKQTFAPYQLKFQAENSYAMSREEAISIILAGSPDDSVIVSTTGMISREVYEYRTRHDQPLGRDFLTVGCMGHCSQIALGIALAQPQKNVIILDGDGALLMHLGSTAILGQRRPPNLTHVVLNNGAHDSVGGQPTVGFDLDIPAIATACGYPSVGVVDSVDSLKTQLEQTKNQERCLSLLEVRVKRGSRADLGRPKSSPIENKQAFMQRLQSL